MMESHPLRPIDPQQESSSGGPQTTATTINPTSGLLCHNSHRKCFLIGLNGASPPPTNQLLFDETRKVLAPQIIRLLSFKSSTSWFSFPLIQTNSSFPHPLQSTKHLFLLLLFASGVTLSNHNPPAPPHLSSPPPLFAFFSHSD